jgi:hypothetical protein
MVMKLEESGQVKWPSGKIISLDLPKVSNQFFVVRYPPGHPEQAHVVSTALSKEDLFHNFFHFSIKRANPLKRCSSCQQQLAQSRCIQTDIICILHLSLHTFYAYKSKGMQFVSM